MKKNLSIIAIVFALVYLFIGLVALCFDSEFASKLSAYIIVIDGFGVILYFIIKWVVELVHLHRRDKLRKCDDDCLYS